jgi:DNA-binding NarL/FixJ family response regulator
LKKIRIIIADDHTVVWSGLRTLLEQCTDFTVVGEAPDGQSALDLAKTKTPDVVILDISMPGMNGILAAERFRADHPEIGILILTIYDNEEYVNRLIHAGANGYVMKDAGRKELYDAVRAVGSGGTYFSPGISRIIVGEFVKHARTPNGTDGNGKPPLTRREGEILRLIAGGMTNPRIAEKLFLSIRTVNTHRVNLMRKLDIHDVAGLVRYAIQAGLIEVGRQEVP